MWQQVKQWACALRRDVMTVWFCGRDPETPLLAKLLALGLAAYALSPVDLIPDFIPVIGYLDEVVLLPLGIWCCLKLVPEPVLTRSRAAAAAWLAERREKPRSMTGLVVIVSIWTTAMAALLAWILV